MNGHEVWAAVVMRSARPSASPPWVSTMSQPSSAISTAVTAAATRPLKPSGYACARQTAHAGQIVIAAAPSTVQARCSGEDPRTGSGQAAMPMLARPATVSTIRAPLSPAAVTRWQPPTRNNAAVMIHRSVPAWPASTLTVWRTGL